ncbi:hypothetical protein D5b_00127 [Faustovirus]|nr:hypothetical protein D5b_00127 [Faustovirus]AMN84784.1 hypothetical protein D6_00384 [Faustovirus]
MDVFEERQIDDKIMDYVGAKLMKIGDFLLTISRIGGYITAICVMWNSRCYAKLLAFQVYAKQAKMDHWSDNLTRLEYYDINNVKSKVAKLLESSRIDTLLGGATFLCGAIGAAAVALGDQLRCNYGGIDYLLKRGQCRHN